MIQHRNMIDLTNGFHLAISPRVLKCFGEAVVVCLESCQSHNEVDV